MSPGGRRVAFARFWRAACPLNAAPRSSRTDCWLLSARGAFWGCRKLPPPVCALRLCCGLLDRLL
eukprot:6148486-Pyramimonas_sp.AAC.1